MRIFVCQQTIPMKYHTLYLSKIRKDVAKFVVCCSHNVYLFVLDYVKNCDMMWKQSVWSSSIAASLAAKHLKEGGLLTLPGAMPALKGTPGIHGSPLYNEHFLMQH